MDEEPALADLAAQVIGPPPPSTPSSSRSGALTAATAIAVGVAVTWSVSAVVVDLFMFPGALSRVVGLLFGGAIGLVVLGVLIAGWLGGREGRVPKRLGRVAGAIGLSAVVVWALCMANLPMRARVALAAPRMKDQAETASRLTAAPVPGTENDAPPVQLGPFTVVDLGASDCGGPSRGVGASAMLYAPEQPPAPSAFALDLRPRLLYCPSGIDLGSVGDNHADIEHLANDWWIDWQDD